MILFLEVDRFQHLSVLAALGGGLLQRGLLRRKNVLILSAALVLAVTILFFALLSFWGELLWFESLGYGNRFLREVLARIGFAAAGAFVSAVFVGLLTSFASRRLLLRWRWPVVLGAAGGGLWGFFSWGILLRAWFGIRNTGIRDPILRRDVGFYLFSLPFYDALLGFFSFLIGIAVLVAILQAIGTAHPRPRPLLRALGLGCLLFAFGSYLAVFHLMYSRWGVVHGPGWLAEHVLLPAYYVVMAGALLVAGLLLVPPLSSWLYRSTQRRIPNARRALSLAAGLPIAALAGLAALALWAIPALVTWLYVLPNELTLERQYLANNIRFTWDAFDLTRIKEQPFPDPVPLSPSMAKENPNLLSEIRLWDPRVLQAVLQAEAAAYPELRLVVLMTGDRLSYAPTFDAALAQLLQERP